MATGDQNDFSQRIQALLPAGWFGDDGIVISAVTTGIGAAWAAIWNQITYVTAQTRLATAYGFNLDLFNQDFFGTGLLRMSGETDAAFRARIQASLFSAKGTRSAVTQAASLASGKPVTAVEFNRLADTGAMDNGTMAYDTAGCWGTRLMPGQFLLNAPRAAGVSQTAIYTAVNNTRPINSIAWTDT